MATAAGYFTSRKGTLNKRDCLVNCCLQRQEGMLAFNWNKLVACHVTTSESAPFADEDCKSRPGFQSHHMLFVSRQSFLVDVQISFPKTPFWTKNPFNSTACSMLSNRNQSFLLDRHEGWGATATVNNVKRRSVTPLILRSSTRSL